MSPRILRKKIQHLQLTNPQTIEVYILLNNKVYVVSFQQKSIGGLKSVGLYPHKTLGVFKHAFFKTIGVFRSLGVLNLRICCGEFFFGAEEDALCDCLRQRGLSNCDSIRQDVKFKRRSLGDVPPESS